MIKMNEEKLILSKYSSGYFVSSVKENKKWNNIEQRYKNSKEIYEDIEQLQNNWNELKNKYKKLRDFIIDYGNWNGDELIDNKVRELEQGKDD